MQVVPRKWAEALEGLFACSYFYLLFPSFLSLSKLEVDPEIFMFGGGHKYMCLLDQILQYDE